ncbi:hypothetical protein [Streptosporangium sp. NPDC049644]|uniref:hypothetical protein n=1 Tax=Streptosporangium sp. NPDC049644 TaxID=3155507 RepID=UPI0034202BF5
MRHPLVHRLAAYCGAVGLLTGLLTVAAPAASAADTTTDLALTSDGTTLFSAADTPGHFTRYDTGTLAATGT